ncbi:MAG: hypothetical protein HYU58_00200 [Proteobacteria bacterium]|nr:hypothetical protein [Pseudomonadota bacterium]
MSFNAAQLSVLAYANGFTHWHYRTADSLDLVLSPVYFAPAAEMLRAGDQITLNLQQDATIGLAHLVVANIVGRQLDLALVAASPTRQAMRQAA